MVVRVFIGTLIGTVILFGWGAASWMALPYHNATMHQLPAEEQFIEHVRAKKLEPGVYWYPGHSMDREPTEQEVADYEARLKEGPIGMLVVQRGMEPMNPRVFAGGIALYLLQALLVACMGAAAIPRFERCISKILFVVAFGVFLCLAGPLTNWNWMQMPLDYEIANCLDALISWTIVGIVFSKLLDKKPAVAAA